MTKEDRCMLDGEENGNVETERGRSKKGAFDAIVLALKDKDEVNLLFMCSANICRSPYAEMRFEQLMEACTKTINVASGGFTTSVTIHPFSKQALLEAGVPVERIDRFSPRNMRKHKDELDAADIIFAPSKEVISMMPSKYLDKTFLFSEATGIEMDINDPVLLKEYQPYKAILDHLDSYLVDIARIMQET
jgi:protein-tyrosine-phosphatase